MEEQRGRAPFVIVALVCAGIIVGATTWFYIQRNTTADDAAAIQTAPTETTESRAETAKNELASSLDELDREIAAIEIEEESDDDSIDY